MPDLKALKHFIHLSSTLHFGRSSEALYVSPSTLSRSIAKLEEEVGVDLFERDNRSVVLTESGELFLSFANDTLTAWQNLLTTLSSEPGELSGRIKIYCSVTASYSFMSTILTRFRKLHPGCEVSLTTGDASFAIDKVLDGEVDVAIAPKPDMLSGQLAFQSVVETPLVFVGPALKCPVGDMVSDSAYDWSRISLILPEFGLSRKRVDAWFKKQGMRPNIQAEVVGHEAIVSMVALGMGVGVVPGLVIDSSPIKDSLLKLSNAPVLPAYNVGIVALDKRLSDPVVETFWRIVCELVASGDLK